MYSKMNRASAGQLVDDFVADARKGSLGKAYQSAIRGHQSTLCATPMSPDPFEFRAQELPADLPPCEQIVQLCAEAGFHQNGISFPSTGNPRFWIKYGVSLTLGEALTQDAVAQIVNEEPSRIVRVPEVYAVFVAQSCRYIIMQYIAGDTVASRQPSSSSYAPGDVEAVAAAYNRLVSLRVSADSAPGFVGENGLVGHDFFVERLSTIRYADVFELQAQINRVRLFSSIILIIHCVHSVGCS